MKRWLQNLFTTSFALRRRFPARTLQAIDDAITASEAGHRAEVRCAIETALPWRRLLRGQTCTERAREVFADLHVWDTAENNGVLLYVLIAEHDIEIVADRGFSARVPDDEWSAICARLEQDFREQRYEAGVLDAVARIGELAASHFPPGDADRNELPNRPVVL